MLPSMRSQARSRDANTRWNDRAVRRCVVFALALIGCGCAAPPPKPKVLAVEVQAAANVNPDSRGRASPVVVRVYALKSAGSFESADFVSLYDKDQATLGADIVAREEFVLQPGETKTLRPAPGDSKFLAVMAAFRDLERARWRAVSALTPASDNTFALKLEASSLSLTKR